MRKQEDRTEGNTQHMNSPKNGNISARHFQATIGGCNALVVAAGLLTLFVVSMRGFAQDRPSEMPDRKVRKAIPVARGVEGSGGSRFAGSNGSLQEGRASVDANGSRPGSHAGDSSGSDIRNTTAPNTMKALNDKRRIGIRDKLSFNVLEDEAQPRQIIVTDSGEIDVPYVGRVEVGNRTCKELALHIKRLLEKEYYYQATVLIGLDSAGGQVMSKGRFYIDGQVNRPAPYEIPVDEVLTVSRAIIRAGGFTSYANRRKVKLFRKNSATNEMEIHICDMVAVMEKGQTRDDLEVMPDDRIVIEEKFFNF